MYPPLTNSGAMRQDGGIDRSLQKKENTHKHNFSMNEVCRAYMSVDVLCLQGKIEEALICCREGIDKSKHHNDFEKWIIGKRKLIDLLIKQMDIYDAKRQADKSIKVIDEVMQIKRELGDDDTLDWGTLLHYRGSAANELFKFEEGWTFLSRGLNMNQRNQRKVEFKTAHLYMDLGFTYQERGDLDMGIQMISRGLQIFEKYDVERLFDDEKVDVCAGYNNIGICLFRKGAYEQAIKSHKKLIDILGEKNPQIIFSYSNIGTAYFFLEKYQEAIDYFKRAEEKFDESLEKGLVEEERRVILLPAYVSLGNSYSKLQPENPQIKEFLLKAIELGEKHNNTYLAGAYYSYSHYLEYCGEFEKALWYVQKAFSIVLPDYSNDNYEDNPVFKPAYVWSFSPLIFKIFVSKIKRLRAYYEATKKEKLLLLTLKTIEVVNEYFYALRNSYKAETSKYVIAQDSKFIYENAIYACLQLFENQEDTSFLEKAFQYAEKGRAFMLLNTLKKREAQKENIIDKDFLKQEKNFRITLADIEKKISIAKLPQQKTEQIAAFNEVQEKYNDLVKTLQETNPAYFDFVKKETSITLRELQNGLREDEYLIEYFVGVREVFVFGITKNDQVIYHTIERNAEFEEKIQAFKNSLSASIEVFKEKAHTLYQLLVAPILDHLQPEKKIKKIVVIIDKMLDDIPFEALLMEQKEVQVFQELPYLIRKFNIQYHYSTQLFLYSRQRNSKKTNIPQKFVGIVPEYGDDKSEAVKKTLFDIQSYLEEKEINAGVIYPMGEYRKQIENIEENAEYVVLSKKNLNDILEEQEQVYQPLPHSLIEAKNVQANFEKKQYQTDLFINKQATKKNLNAAIQTCDYLLISAHTAKVEELFWGNYGIVLSETENEKNYDLLFANEVYNFETEAKVIILNTCDSGVGDYKVGESIMNMGRGFIAAGANNVIYTLCKVYDNLANKLVRYFFDFLLDDYLPTEALCQAKRKMIQEENLLPMHWASHVLIGSE